MHLVIYFCGTGSKDSHHFIDGYDYVPYKDPNIQTLFIRGCEDPYVCDSSLFPNLKKFATRFCQRIFTTSGDKLKPTLHFSRKNLSELNAGVNDTVLIETRNHENPKLHDSVLYGDLFNVTHVSTDSPIESITLCGFSRGAVTCFEVAKQLNALAPNIPVDIIANQPVPGNSYQGPGTNASSVADCTQLTNLRKVTVILGAYTGESVSKKTNKEKTSKLHRLFFSQILPTFAANVLRKIVVIPKISHRKAHQAAPNGHGHLHMYLAENLSENGLIDDHHFKRKKELVTNNYLTKDSNKTGIATFPPDSRLQPIYGLSSNEVYNHIDKLYPYERVWRGYEFKAHETLVDWWMRQEKKASCFSSQLTKELVKKIQDTTEQDCDSLADLFIQCDTWLILKENQKTSRYHQVESLRNHLYHLLTNSPHIIREGVVKLTLDNINKNNYFLHHWKSQSHAASFFKTDATRSLDKAFMTYASSDHTVDDYDNIIASLNEWLKLKTPATTSKRYNLVLNLRDRMIDFKNELLACSTQNNI